MAESPMKARKASPLSTILLAGFVAGTLDITAACIQYYINTGKGPGNVLRFVARGALGRSATSGGMTTAMWGLLFHYCIAFIWTIFFFWIYSIIPLLAKNKVVTGLVYGLFVWIIMNRVVVPLSAIPPIPFKLKSAAIAAGIIMVCIGLPIALIVGRYYDREKRLR